MRILVVGAGVIGSVYAGQLLHAGHDVALVARGKRLLDLRAHGLVLEDAESGEHRELPIDVLDVPAADARYDLVVVAVRCEQLTGTLPILAAMTHVPDVLFFGNTAGHARGLIEALGDRVLFGFPAAGGVLDGAVVRFVLIRQQKTMLGEPSGEMSSRVRRLQAVFSDAGFPTRLRTAHLAEIPTNLAILYLWMPGEFVVRYWRRILAGPRGELWFAGHTRSAAAEMALLRDELLAAVHRTGRPAPDLDTLLIPA